MLRARFDSLFRKFRESPKLTTLGALEPLVPLRLADELRSENRFLRDEMAGMRSREADYMNAYMERASELIEARQMAGTGPWRVDENARKEAHTALMRINEGLKLREDASPTISQGAYGDIELALQNVEWRREINLSWLEFSRWGIQQIILICRLYYVKNPLIFRCINVISSYVFGRGYEVSSTDPDANDVLDEFFKRNTKILGQVALVRHQRSLSTDGQIFFALISDTTNTGDVNVRTIDATEIQEVITNPEDTDEPWLYKREWTERNFNFSTGVVTTVQRTAYYPALGYDPTEKPDKISTSPVNWAVPLIHFKGGISVAKWHFDVPRTYPAIDWAKASKLFLENCATVKRALAQFAMSITTKGGQQAMQGIKAQMQTTVGPSTNLWDENPPTVAGGTFVSGPGTTVEAFKTQGAGGNPEEIRRFLHWVCIVFDLPETFLADASTGSLATAQSLDRPTELAMLEKQEAWRELLVTIAIYVLRASGSAPSGKLKESLARRKVIKFQVRESARKVLPSGRKVYEKKKKPAKYEMEVRVTFPAIREGDLPALVNAIVAAMTLDNKGGQVVGIDEKIGVQLLYEQLGYEQAQEAAEEQYPEGEYEPDRTKEPEVPPIGKAEPDPGGLPQAPGGSDPTPTDKPVIAAEAKERKRATALLERSLAVLEESR